MPPFLSQAAPRFPGNADVSQGIVALGGAVGNAIKSYQNARAEREIGQALQSGGLPAVQEAASRHGRPDLALKINQMITSRGRAAQADEDRAQDRQFRIDDRQTGIDDKARVRAATERFLAGQDIPPDQVEFFASNPAALKSVLPQGAVKSGLNPVLFRGDDGKLFYGQPRADGTIPRSIVESGATPVKPVTVDLKDSISFVDQNTGKPIANLPKNLERAALQSARGGAQGKAEVKLAGGAGKAAATLKSLEASWKVVDGKIGKSLGSIDWTNTGLVGSLINPIPGTAAHDLARTLDTIKANIGFDKLQSMRDNSPTGGALGQVSEFENRLLQAVNGSLEQNQSPQQLRQNLQEIQAMLGELQKERRAAFEATYLQKKPAPPRQGQPGVVPPGTQQARNPQTGQIMFFNQGTRKWEPVR